MSVGFGPRACNCGTNAVVGVLPMPADTAKAEDVAKAIAGKRAVVMLFFEPSDEHHPHDGNTKLGDMWNAANAQMQREHADYYVTVVDVIKHPKFLEDVEFELRENRKIHTSMPKRLPNLPCTLLVRKEDQGVKIIESSDHLKDSVHYMSFIRTFLGCCSPPRKVPLEDPEVLPKADVGTHHKHEGEHEAKHTKKKAEAHHATKKAQSDHAKPQPDETADEAGHTSEAGDAKHFGGLTPTYPPKKSITIDDIKNLITEHTAKIDEIVKDLSAHETVAVLFTLKNCGACQNCLRGVWDDPAVDFEKKLRDQRSVMTVRVEVGGASEDGSKPPPGSLERAFVDGVSAMSQNGGPMSSFPALVLIKLTPDRLYVRIHQEYGGDPATYMTNVFHQVDSMQPRA